MAQHVLQFDEFETFTGYHYSRQKLKVGDTITSMTHPISDKYGPNVYNKIWTAYKTVANELGLYFPNTYGYAYGEEKKHIINGYMYVVQAPSVKVTKCNYDYSMQLILENSFFSPMNLMYALKNRDALLKAAFDYFSPSDTKHIEYISDCFKIVEVVKLS